jgi:hypothetical protein
MKHLFPAVAFFLSIFFISCDSKTENKEQVLEPTVFPSTTNPVFQGNNDTLSSLNAGVKLNPKHGEPGHRCDIAEGAPLNAPSTNSIIPPNVTSAVPPVATTTATNNVLSNSSTVTPSLTLNPKHGEPGHRCDIAVGAPLKPTQ